jgi:hypothetical protein
VTELNRNRQVYGKPLRISEEVIFLKLEDHEVVLEDKNGEDKAYIHEAQISVMITGLDDWYWTAYCFVDVYFKGMGHRESVEAYSSSGMDPLSGGRTSRDRPTWLPREYFLQLLTYRLEQVKQEWNNTVYQLFGHIQPCVCVFHLITKLEVALTKVLTDSFVH